MIARVLERPPIAPKSMPLGAAVLVGVLVPLELGSRERVVLATGVVEDGHMRRDVLLLDHPVEHRRHAVGGVADEALGSEAEAFCDPLDHRLGRFDLLCPMRGRRLDVHDDPGLQIDEVVGRVGVGGRPARSRGPPGGWIGQRDVLGHARVIFFAAGVGSLEAFEVLAHGAARAVTCGPVDWLAARHATGAVDVGLDDAGIDREALAGDQPFLHAAAQDAFEDVAEGIALAEAAVPVLGEGRVVGDGVVEVETAEPAIRQVQADLLAEPTLGSNAEAVADDQHSDHQFRIDRGAAGVAVERCEVMPQLAEVEEAVDGSQQVSARHVLLQVERVEELVLPAALLTHHRCAPSLRRAQHKRERCLFFNKIQRVPSLEFGPRTHAPARHQSLRHLAPSRSGPAIRARAGPFPRPPAGRTIRVRDRGQRAAL